MNQLAEKIAAEGKNLKWLGVVAIVLGILAMLMPLMTGMSIVLMVGIFVVAAGIARMTWAFGSSTLGSGLLRFAIGLLTLVCGIIMVTDPIVATGVLTIMIAVYLWVDGGFEIAAALTGPKVDGRGWMLFGGLLSILLGIMIWRQFPLSGAWALGIFLGVKLLVIGMAMVGVGRVAQKAA